jgi:hypothetical protein
MAQGQKKVVVRRFEGAVAWGYLPQEGLVRSGEVDLLAADGRNNSIPLNEIKLIAYVRDFNLDDPVNPERLLRKTFAARPRGDGLWLRASFLDGDLIEGLADFGLPLLDTAMADGGLFLTPPDQRGNTLRLFIPRAALRSLEVLGWVTAPSRRLAAPAAARPRDEPQAGLFE